MQGGIVPTGKIATLNNQPMYYLKFNISGDWQKGVESVITIVDSLKEKHPDSNVQAEVQFG